MENSKLFKEENRKRIRTMYLEIKENLNNPERLEILRRKYGLTDEKTFKTALLISKYILTQEEYEDYLTKAIFIMYGTSKPVENPKAIFVVGQPGAGKSFLDTIAYEDVNCNAIVDDYDMVRRIHPKFDLAFLESKVNLHNALMTDADWVNEDLIEYAKENHYNFISEGTMRRTDFFVSTVKDFKKAGFDVQMYLMAVPELESYGSTIERYAYMLEHYELPRWISEDVHSECYNKFMETLKILKKEGLYDRAKVFRRGRVNEKAFEPQLLYDTNVGLLPIAFEDKLYDRKNLNGENINEVSVVEDAREFYRSEAIDAYHDKREYVENVFSGYSSIRRFELDDWQKMFERTVREYECDKDLSKEEK